MNKIILASASPRRKELLAQIGLEFVVCKSTCEEKVESTVPEKVVCALSAQKAEDVFYGIREGRMTVPEGWENAVVVGADTIVSYEGKILGKPKDEADAIAMLSALSGNLHEVYTGVTICFRENGQDRSHTFFEKTEVVFYPMSEREIAEYVASGDSIDKAGSYGIQGRFATFIKEIHGDYNNVVGLPVGRLYQELKECLHI